MHRLSRVSKCSKSVTKFKQIGSKDTPTNHAYRHNLTSHLAKRSPSYDYLNPRMLAGNVSGAPHNGGLVSRMFVRYSATFQLHPEKMKQIMRERDGQHLCNYYDSDNYKKKAVNVVEEQNRVINEGTPQNLNETDVIYEHMLSCAQPRQKPKLIVVQKKKSKEEVMAEPPVSIRAKLRGGSKKKKEPQQDTAGLPVRQPQIVYAPDSSTKKEGMNIKDYRRKYRKRTTILPVYLKKIQDNMAMKEKLANTPQSFSNKTAQKFSHLEKVNYETQLLNSRKPIYIIKSEYKNEPDKKAEEQTKREKLINVEYETEVLNIDRFKVKSKYAEGGEQNRHWYQNPNTSRKIAVVDSDIEHTKVD